MQPKALLAGLIMLTVGIYLAFFWVYTYTVEVPTTQTKELMASTFVVGDYYYKDAFMPGNVKVVGHLSVSIPSTGQSADVNFFIFDEDNFKRWMNREKDLRYVLQLPRTGDSDFSFGTESNATYYFVLDNTYDLSYKKSVTLNVSYEYVTYVQEKKEDRSLNNVGMAMTVISMAVVLYGIVKRQEIPWR